jgi:BolA family transcriptional regulator, general stress-responsive regulator
MRSRGLIFSFSTVKNALHARLSRGLSPDFLEVINESHMHRVVPGSETHFKLVIASSQFKGKSPVEKHRMVYKLIEDIKNEHKIHAIAISATEEIPSEKVGGSPPCLGKSKH